MAQDPTLPAGITDEPAPAPGVTEAAPRAFQRDPNTLTWRGVLELTRQGNPSPPRAKS